jgi:hypothetical protein
VVHKRKPTKKHGPGRAKTLSEVPANLQDRGSGLYESYGLREWGEYENGKTNGRRRKLQTLIKC